MPTSRRRHRLAIILPMFVSGIERGRCVMNNVLTVYISTAERAYQGGDFALSEKLLRFAVREGKRQGSNPEMLATFMENMAEAQLKQGKVQSAISLLKRALDTRSTSDDRYVEHLVRLSYKIADAYLRIKYYHRTEFFLKRGLLEEIKTKVNLQQFRRLRLALEAQNKHEQGRVLFEILNELIEIDGPYAHGETSQPSGDARLLLQRLRKVVLSKPVF